MSFRLRTTRRSSFLLRRLARPRSYKEAWGAGDSQTPWYLRRSMRTCHARAAARSSLVLCTWATTVPTAVPPHVIRSLAATATPIGTSGEIVYGKFAAVPTCFSCHPQVKHTESGLSRPCYKLVDESSRGRARPSKRFGGVLHVPCFGTLRHPARVPSRGRAETLFIIWWITFMS